MQILAKVRIKSKEQCLNETNDYECNVSKFYEYCIDKTFTNVVQGDSKKFYFNCAKHCILIVPVVLDQLNYGVGIQTMQGFKHRNE